jgi:multicomponent Na+:H+ antiporter subunit E
MKWIGRVGVLVVLWLLAWGDPTLANLLSGVAAAALLLLAFPPSSRLRGRVRISSIGVARLSAYVVRQLVVSNVLMARQILSRHPDARPGVLAHRLHRPSEEVVTVMTSVIALSPGTMTADVDDDSSTIYVHFFRLLDVEAARAGLDRLEHLVLAAVGAPTSPHPSPSSEESP